MRRGFFLPARASSIVDLPDPLGPMIAIIDPGSAYPAKEDLVLYATNQSDFRITVYEISKKSSASERASERVRFFFPCNILVDQAAVHELLQLDRHKFMHRDLAHACRFLDV